jgi:hypothetical protein
VRLAVATLVGVVAAAGAVSLYLTGGTFAYPLDDPAIHLSVARRLAYDGTWGVVPGDFQNASSSPLWTLVLAPTQLIARGAAGEVVPLGMSVLAGVGVIRLLGPELAGLRPSRRRLLDAAAVVVASVGLLYLPALALMGMEHVLHMALALAAVLAVEARWAGGGWPTEAAARAGPAAGARAWRPWTPVALVALATATRFETGGLVLALGAALLAVGVPGWHDAAAPPPPRRQRLRGALALVGASAGTVALFGAVGLAFGQEILPNSVLLKSIGDRGDTRWTVGSALERLAADPLLVAFVVIAVAVLVATRRAAAQGRPLPAGAAFPAVVAVVAALVHAHLGAIEPSLRYEAYLYGPGTLTVLRALPLAQRALAVRGVQVSAAALLVALAPAAALQAKNTVVSPQHSALTWEQRYQVARFVAEAYRGQPVAIGELGYISLYHEGPLTDVYGLADHEVLEARLAGRDGPAYWRDLQRRRGFPVAVTYSFTLSADAPDDWIHVANWRSPDAWYEDTRFWATEPEEVDRLLALLRDFEPSLPDEVEVTYNELASLGASLRLGEGG